MEKLYTLLHEAPIDDISIVNQSNLFLSIADTEKSILRQIPEFALPLAAFDLEKIQEGLWLDALDLRRFRTDKLWLYRVPFVLKHQGSAEVDLLHFNLATKYINSGGRYFHSQTELMRSVVDFEIFKTRGKFPGEAELIPIAQVPCRVFEAIMSDDYLKLKK